jgi:hypothetical protein
MKIFNQLRLIRVIWMSIFFIRLWTRIRSKVFVEFTSGFVSLHFMSSIEPDDEKRAEDKIEEDKIEEAEVDETLDESFPASDPPSWTLGRDDEDA